MDETSIMLLITASVLTVLLIYEIKQRKEKEREEKITQKMLNSINYELDEIENTLDEIQKPNEKVKMIWDIKKAKKEEP